MMVQWQLEPHDNGSHEGQKSRVAKYKEETDMWEEQWRGGPRWLSTS